MRSPRVLPCWSLLFALAGCATSGGADDVFVPAKRLPPSARRPARPPPASPPPAARASPPPAPASAVPPALAPSGCGQDIPGLAELVRPGALLVLGDQYGSNEIPAFVGNLACLAHAAGHPVQLAMEVPANEQPLLDRYLAGGGTRAERQALLQGLFWLRPYQDGRSSRAVLGLLERLRALGTRGPRAKVVACDDPHLQGNEREAFMAKRVLVARAAAPEAVTIALVGNVHARTVKGVPWDETFVPMGWNLAQAEPGLLSLDADYTAGTAWVCVLEPNTQCGVRRVSAPRRTGPQPHGPSPYVLRTPAPSPEGYHGLFYVGPLTASPPATWES